MDVTQIINKYYPNPNELKHILWVHCTLVKEKALAIAETHPELNANKTFLAEAAMVHDIGIFLTNAPGIQCFGQEHYLRHGVLGADLMRKEGFENHARVCERHTGTGLTKEAIIKNKLPLPLQDFLPETIEEQIICFADKFFSKTHLEKEKTPEQAMHSLEHFGEKGVEIFKEWMIRFL